MVKLGSLGDVVHALPLLESLRHGLGPNAFIGWAVKKKWASLLRGNPHISQLYELEGSGIGDVWMLGQTLRRETFDTALDAQGLLVSGLVTRLSNAPVRIGLTGNREGNRLFLTDAVVPSTQRAHMVDKLLGFCDALGIPRVAPRPQTYLAQSHAPEADALLAPLKQNGGPIVGCFVGASTPDKVWPPDKWAELVRLLVDAKMNVVLLGAQGEAATAQTVQSAAGSSVRVLNLTGKLPDLGLLASVLAQCSVIVGGDSGPTHLAVAVGTPIVGLYGVTDPTRTGPTWGSAPAVVLDYAQADAPPELRRPRHSTLTDALARIPAPAVFEAVCSLTAEGVPLPTPFIAAPPAPSTTRPVTAAA